MVEYDILGVFIPQAERNESPLKFNRYERSNSSSQVYQQARLSIARNNGGKQQKSMPPPADPGGFTVADVMLPIVKLMYRHKIEESVKAKKVVKKVISMVEKGDDNAKKVCYAFINNDDVNGTIIESIGYVTTRLANTNNKFTDSSDQQKNLRDYLDQVNELIRLFFDCSPLQSLLIMQTIKDTNLIATIPTGSKHVAQLVRSLLMFTNSYDFDPTITRTLNCTINGKNKTFDEGELCREAYEQSRELLRTCDIACRVWLKVADPEDYTTPPHLKRGNGDKYLGYKFTEFYLKSEWNINLPTVTQETAAERVAYREAAQLVMSVQLALSQP